MSNLKQIFIAGGCFWGVEEFLRLIPGVLETEAVYANGKKENPTYREVCSGNTGFAEAVRVKYDSDKISLAELLNLFYKIIDPTSLNRQGNDFGEQYRTGIYFEDQDDLSLISASLEELAKSLDRPLVVEAKPLENYYPAEEYHQKYLEKNPGGYCHIPRERFLMAKYYKSSGKEQDNDLRSRLSPLEYEVTQNAATEPPFRNKYFANFEPGLYVDIVDGTPLFLSTQKFESGCGWPSFSRPIEDASLEKKSDLSHGMVRVEVRSSKSGSHLGHVFPDGPKDGGGLRYCINSSSLRFIPKDKMKDEGYGELLNLFDDAMKGNYGGHLN
ncbi:MAG: peptide-methionine (S)-S-oxide reductase MsrA [Deltaproteobacteria bacterium]|jgi:peptide methionine sulfoxide reductase msrA/msrB|nr:peptide-methionine (S)-S-oxide reductase MsrA [Deltaproteobacteria bacterium]